MDSISIVIFVNRRDYFFTKLCVASIRYYYPNVEIFLVKDSLNGNFNTKLIERKFNVKPITLSKKYFGWGASKLHFLLENNTLDKKILFLDSDIIFLGNVLEKLCENNSKIIVNPEYYTYPMDPTVMQYYVDPEKIKLTYPQYDFPGYFFNVGQFVINPTIFHEKYLKSCFDKNKFPYFIDYKNFNTAEQSILNVIFPIICKEKNITLGIADFMKWSVSFFNDEKNDDINLLLDGKCDYLLHYAGDIRNNQLLKMKGYHLLTFFRNEYNKKLNYFQQKYSNAQDVLHSNKLLNKLLYKLNRLKMLAIK
jgi:hypothetical protein